MNYGNKKKLGTQKSSVVKVTKDKTITFVFIIINSHITSKKWQISFFFLSDKFNFLQTAENIKL